MSYTKIDQVKSPQGANGGTSSPKDLSAADFVVAIVVSYTGAAAAGFNDNSSGTNTFTPMTARTAGNIRIQLHYCQGFVGNGSHTFSTTGTGSYSNAHVIAFSGGATSGGPDQSNNGTTTGSTIQPGSVDPSPEDNELVIVGASGCVPPSSISSPYTITTEDANGGSGFAGGIAYAIQTTATATNPTWTTGDASGSGVAVIATFKVAGTGGGRFFRNNPGGQLSGLGSSGPLFQNPLQRAFVKRRGVFIPLSFNLKGA
jgi:hypothetical protein